MKRRFVNKILPSLRRALLAGLGGCAVLGLASSAAAQEIQLTGPLAGAPAVRKLRLHRAGRFEISPGVSFSLLDQYQRTIMPGATLTYHPTDWLGLGVFGGVGISGTTGLTDELQQVITQRDCAANGASTDCRLTATNLTRPGLVDPTTSKTSTGQLTNDQLGAIAWVIAPQVTAVPFRGKISLLSALFVDTDVNFFLGPAFVGLNERTPCGFDDNHSPLPPCSQSFSLTSRVAVAPTFGLGLNFYPSPFIGFGAEFRALPFNWNTSGFDNHGGGPGNAFPDGAINSADREFHFNSFLTVKVSVQLPTQIKTTD
jgi:hypothetical protein